MDFFVFLSLEPDSYNVFKFFSKVTLLKKTGHICIYIYIYMYIYTYMTVFVVTVPLLRKIEKV